MLEAYGKCADTENIDQLTKLGNTLKTGNYQGLAAGLYRFASRGATSSKATEEQLTILVSGTSATAKLYAAHYFARAQKVDFTPWAAQLLEITINERDTLAKMALISSLGNAKTEAVANYLSNHIGSPDDYRVISNALGAFAQYNYNAWSETAFAALKHPNPNVGIRAAELLLAKGTQTHAMRYFTEAKQAKNGRVAASLFRAAAKYSNSKTKIVAEIIHRYKHENHTATKALLIMALAETPEAYQTVAEAMLSDKKQLIRTNAASALVSIRKNKGFEAFNKRTDTDLHEIFDTYIKAAINTLDVAIVTEFAFMLQVPVLGYKERITDLSFLEDAAKKCQLPRDFEAYQALHSTLNFLKGISAEITNPKSEYNAPVRSEILSIKSNQLVDIVTDKGTITVELFIDESPASVANFIKLIQTDFYGQPVFHRVVPNFVIQDGCPRGDGWGGPDHTIRSELGMLNYGEGYLGMASAGKDTEGSQWFITHSPTPHLDGRYTIFGKVVLGMEVAHQITVGTQITNYVIK